MLTFREPTYRPQPIYNCNDPLNLPYQHALLQHLLGVFQGAGLSPVRPYLLPRVYRPHNAVDACSIQHFCPACRAPYNVVTAEPALVPPHLRPHLLPHIRPVFFDAAPQTTSASMHSDLDLGRALAGNTALRLACAPWRRRAEVHAAANKGLLMLARTGKIHALHMQAERDEALRLCSLLKRKLYELVPDLESKPRDAAHAHESLHLNPTQKQPYAHAPHAHPHAPLPRAPSRPLAPTVPKRSCSPVCIVGLPLKRRRRSASVEARDAQVPLSVPHTIDAPHAPVPSTANLAHADAPKSAPPTRTAPPHPPFAPHSASPSTPPSPLLSPRAAPALWTPPPPPPPCGLVEAAYRGLDAALAGAASCSRQVLIVRAGQGGTHPIP
ncbi:hypothetical protein C8J57DRAFT_1500020 [Mycena rebaudengoi]|nr:hypothetical protein C8J57DRAFT_1500020 [Mycena rebaudengoi]